MHNITMENELAGVLTEIQASVKFDDAFKQRAIICMNFRASEVLNAQKEKNKQREKEAWGEWCEAVAMLIRAAEEVKEVKEVKKVKG